MSAGTKGSASLSDDRTGLTSDRLDHALQDIQAAGHGGLVDDEWRRHADGGAPSAFDVGLDGSIEPRTGVEPCAALADAAAGDAASSALASLRAPSEGGP